MNGLIVLHTNDIHGRVEGLARMATLVARIREENPDTPVLYFDCGDVEEPSQRISNVTKGAGMHRLLNAAGCDAGVAGNGAWLRYGPQVLREHAAAARYPLLVANLRTLDGGQLDGTHSTTVVEAGPLRLGLIGLTADMPGHAAVFGMVASAVEPLAAQLAGELLEDGADALIVLSHLGLKSDRALAPALAGRVLAILGGHSHDLLPEGEQVDGVWLAQTGRHAEHLGRIDFSSHDGRLSVARVSTIPVTDDIPLSPAVMAEARSVEAEGERYLDEVVGILAEPLDFAPDRECGVANLMADVLLERMAAEVGVVAAGQAFTGPLPGGPLRRGALWDVCSSSANPALVELTGAQLQALLDRGLDPAYAADRPYSLRGDARGLFHVGGGIVRDGLLLVNGEPVDPERTYRVAGTDWEFEPYGGYAPKEWGLQPRYDVPTIMREALEDYLRDRGPVTVTMGRLDAEIKVEGTTLE